MIVSTALRLRSRVGDTAIRERLMGKILGPADYDVLITGPTRITKPDGSPLCVFLPGAVAEHSQNEDVYRILNSFKGRLTKNRGVASGTRRLDPTNRGRSYAKEIPSAVAGAMDPAGQKRYCRLTAWTGENLPSWETLHPLLKTVAAHLEQQVPDRFEAQAEVARMSDPAWVVPGTPFSFRLLNGVPTGSAFHFVGLAALNAPFKGGTMIPVPQLVNGPFPLDGTGALTLAGTWPAGGSGLTLWAQFWMPNGGGPVGFIATSGVRAQIP